MTCSRSVAPSKPSQSLRATTTASSISGQRVAVDATEFKDGKAHQCLTSILRALPTVNLRGQGRVMGASPRNRCPRFRSIDRRHAPIVASISANEAHLALKTFHVARRLRWLLASSMPRQSRFNRDTVQPFYRSMAPELQKPRAKPRIGVISVFVAAIARAFAASGCARHRCGPQPRCPTARRCASQTLDDFVPMAPMRITRPSRAFAAGRTLAPRGRIPATWIADVASVPWMDNELGEPCFPVTSFVRTAEYI